MDIGTRAEIDYFCTTLRRRHVGFPFKIIQYSLLCTRPIPDLVFGLELLRLAQQGLNTFVQRLPNADLDIGGTEPSNNEKNIYYNVVVQLHVFGYFIDSS
jgi:hypothetical protein